MNLTIYGRVFSKKNSKRIIPLRGKRRFVLLSSVAFNNFERDAVEQMRAQVKELIQPPYEVIYQFNIKGKAGADFDNMCAGINDCLEKAGIIDNDKNIIKFSGEVTKGCNAYSTDLQIFSLKNE